MNAIIVRSLGGPDVLRLESVETPRPRTGSALVRVEAIGVNFIDTYHRTGLYPVELPFTPGLEGAGVIEALGADEDARSHVEPHVLSVGDRVAWSDAIGSYAEYVQVPLHRLVKLPEDVGTDLAGALMLQGMTAHYLATDTYPIDPSTRILVHAAAGGVGLLLTQIAKMKGAFVFGTVSTAEKARLATEAGCDRVIRYTEEDFAEIVRDETHGAGVDVVYDSVGRSTIMHSMDCLRRRGMLVSFGQSSGKIEPIDPGIFARKGSLFFTRPSLMHYVAEDEELQHRAGEVLAWVGAERLRVRIGERHPLSQAATAHERLEGRHTTGKVILEP